jgi:hypothetical protein
MSAVALDRLVTIWMDANTETIEEPHVLDLDECSICLDSYVTETAKRVTITGCYHVFGKSCLVKYLNKNPKEDKKCPLCRAAWMPAPEPPRVGRTNRFFDFPNVPMNGVSVFGDPGILDVAVSPRSLTETYMPQRVQARPAPVVASAVAAGSPRARPVPGNEIISIESSSDDDDFEEFSREIANMRDRARRTGLSRRQRRDEDTARASVANRARAVAQTMSISERMEQDAPLGYFASRPNRFLPIPGSVAGANTDASARTHTTSRIDHAAQSQAEVSVQERPSVQLFDRLDPNTGEFARRPRVTATSFLDTFDALRRVTDPTPVTTQGQAQGQAEDTAVLSPNGVIKNEDEVPRPSRVIAQPTSRAQRQRDLHSLYHRRRNHFEGSAPLILNSSSESEIDIEPSPMYSRSKRAAELQNEQSKRNNEKEKELTEIERKLNDRERTLHEQEQRLFQREQNVAQAERKVGRKEALRKKQAEKEEAMKAKHAAEMEVIRQRHLDEARDAF